VFEGDRQQAGSVVLMAVYAGFSARQVRGGKMRQLGGVFDEFAAAWQFPLRFGEDKAGFEQCLRRGLGADALDGFVTVVLQPDQVLADEPGELGWLAAVLDQAAADWGGAETGAVPFHVVLAGDAAELVIARRRWGAAGADFADLGGFDELRASAGLDTPEQAAPEE
jgi:hypothetical protein